MTDEQDQPDASTDQGRDRPEPPNERSASEDPAATTMNLSALGSTEVGEPAPAGDQVAPAIEPGTVASLRPGTALLRVDHGPNAGSRFLLDSDLTTVGRHPSSDIFLDDVTVSRKHAEFVREGSGFSVRDIGSLNGTYVNRQRIDASPLATGDEVQVGKFRLVVMLGEGE